MYRFILVLVFVFSLINIAESRPPIEMIGKGINLSNVTLGAGESVIILTPSSAYNFGRAFVSPNAGGYAAVFLPGSIPGVHDADGTVGCCYNPIKIRQPGGDAIFVNTAPYSVTYPDNCYATVEVME